MRLGFRFQCSGFRFRFDGFPFANRAALGGHAELCPGRASALAAAAGVVECLRIPLRAGAAGGLAGGEDIGRCGSEAGGGPVEERLAEAGGLLREAWRIGFDLRGVLGRVFAAIHAEGACSFTRASAVQAEAAGVSVSRNRCGVRAGHAIVTEDVALVGRVSPLENSPIQPVSGI